MIGNDPRCERVNKFRKSPAQDRKIPFLSALKQSWTKKSHRTIVNIKNEISGTYGSSSESIVNSLPSGSCQKRTTATRSHKRWWQPIRKQSVRLPQPFRRDSRLGSDRGWLGWHSLKRPKANMSKKE